MKSKLDDRRWLLLSEAAELMEHVSTRTLRKHCESGQIPASKRGGGRWFIDLDELRRIRAEQTKPQSLFDQALEETYVPERERDEDE